MGVKQKRELGMTQFWDGLAQGLFPKSRAAEQRRPAGLNSLTADCFDAQVWLFCLVLAQASGKCVRAQTRAGVISSGNDVGGKACPRGSKNQIENPRRISEKWPHTSIRRCGTTFSSSPF